MPTALRRNNGHLSGGVTFLDAESLFTSALEHYGPVRDLELAVQALTAGAPPPYGPRHLRIVVEKAAEISRLRELDAGDGTRGQLSQPAH